MGHQYFLGGSGFFKIICVRNNIRIPATANRTWAMTKGCATCSPNLVAVDADAQRIAKTTPALIHFISLINGGLFQPLIKYLSENNRN